MPRIHTSASAVVDAPPLTVYAILADYKDGHPHILPARYFAGLEVERGGTGAGTRIRFQVRILGRTRTVRADVSEPEPGRVLAETDIDSGAVTTFTVEPREAGRRTLVTISTEWTARGLSGLVERLLAPPLLRRMYAEELQQLSRFAADRMRAGTSP